MANRIVLNTVSYHGKGAIGNIVPEPVSYTHLTLPTT